jgi:hypothetical protein
MAHVQQMDKPTINDVLYNKGESLTQRAFGQEVDNITGKLMVDKLIENTKRQLAIEKVYKAEIINRIVNSTCESKDVIRENGITKTVKELETELRTCIGLGAIK